ncbi:MAG: LacI family DNA-binding transcriptional regulator [Actinomycetota bacterium]
MAQPTMQQVAERAGVSTALVSLVMRGAPNVSDYRRRLVLEAADELGYRPNVLARNLASRRTNTLGVVLNDLHNPYFAEVVDGIQAAADAAQHRLLLGNGKHSLAGEADAVETFLQFRVDGIVVAGSLGLEPIEQASRSAPIVVVGRTDVLSYADTINTDDAAGARLVVDHLVSLGHERIAHIDGGTGAGAPERAEGYRSAMRDHGLDRHIRVAAGDFTEASGASGAAELLEGPERPTAIFASNDLSAIGAFDLLTDRGMSIPDDVSLVGFDNTSLAAMAHVGLTTINQPTYDLGVASIELLLERLDDGRTESTQFVRAPDLIVRTSTAPPPAQEPAP